MKCHYSTDEITEIKCASKNFNEKQRRQYFYFLANKLGYGGLYYISQTFNISRVTLNRARSEIEQGDIWHDGDRIRKEKNYSNDIAIDRNGKNIFTDQKIKKMNAKMRSMSEMERAEYAYQESLKLGKYRFRYISDTFGISLSLLYAAKLNYVLKHKRTYNIDRESIIAKVKEEIGEDHLLTDDEIERMEFFMFSYLDERSRRLYLYEQAKKFGKYGMEYISIIFNISINTLRRAQKDLENISEFKQYTRVTKKQCKKIVGGKKRRIRKVGGGRKSKAKTKKRLVRYVLEIVDTETYGNPMSTRKWTTMSLRKIQKFLKEDYSLFVGIHIIQQILSRCGYGRQKNKKFLQIGKESPDRDAQFKFIEQKIKTFKNTNDPIISVDTLKKMVLGNYASSGTEIRRQKDPRKTYDHDFATDDSTKVVPYGIYLLIDNEGFINLGVSHDTSEFSFYSLLYWWENYGKKKYPNNKRILILADGGDSNRSAGQGWKEQLVIFSIMTGLEVHVCHYPEGCSKYNPIEHRYFSAITANWQGQPKTDLETVKNFIDHTTTTGLISNCHIDKSNYELGKKVFDKDEFLEFNIVHDKILGKYNYVINES